MGLACHICLGNRSAPSHCPRVMATVLVSFARNSDPPSAANAEGGLTRPGGTLDKARQMAAHASTRTTQLYDRREDRVTLDEVVKINIRGWPKGSLRDAFACVDATMFGLSLHAHPGRNHVKLVDL